MKNTFGSSVAVTIFGESHGEAVGAVIDGLAPGLPVNDEFIRSQLDKRKPHGSISTARHESDPFLIVSGVCSGVTTGTPICILIPNENKHSSDYESLRTTPRPSHADWTAQCKYHGYQDYRGGGHFSGRITAALVAAGAIAIDALRSKGIIIGTHIARLADVQDRHFCDYNEDITRLNDMTFAVLDETAAARMHTAAESAAADGDSVGGVLETAVTGVPAGVGEPWFDTMESVLSHILFSVPAVKGVEFGGGFDMCSRRGSEVNDQFCIDGDKVATKTNYSGGINGGITNGMPIIFRCAVKPTPSIYKEQDSVDIMTKECKKLTINGRHDPAIIHRARVVIDSVTALALCDMLALRYGTDYLKQND